MLTRGPRLSASEREREREREKLGRAGLLGRAGCWTKLGHTGARPRERKEKRGKGEVGR
jgi:hypothetical protein